MNNRNLDIGVFGLGKFGLSVVKTLSEYDVNILACDINPDLLAEAIDYASYTVEADVTDSQAMESLEIGNLDVVLFAMGDNFEATIMGTLIAKNLGTKEIIAKAIDPMQEEILIKVGADRVILPEVEIGIKLAKSLVNPNIIDILEKSNAYSIIEMYPLEEWINNSVRDLDIRNKFGYNILAIIREEKTIIPVPADLIIEENDILIILN